MTELTYYDDIDDFIVTFSAETLHTMDKHRQLQSGMPESGGQLFAELEENIVAIKCASEPKPRDIRSRFLFRPFRKAQQIEINHKFNQGLHFVGDWHTHPEDIPKPSQVDIRSICECVQASEHKLRGFLLVIVGRKDFPEGLYVGFSNGKKLRRLCVTAQIIKP